MRMLLCEPQEDLATELITYFQMMNYIVDLETNGLRVLDILSEVHYDVIVIEMALHGLDGISVIKAFRAAKGITPVILLTGMVSSEELQSAFDAGADAYLAKPFRVDDLAAQIRAMLRRPRLRSESVLTLGNLALDTEAGTVTKDNELVHLFPMEFKLLQFLMSHPNQLFDARAIFKRVWQKEDSVTEDTVRTHIRTLRKKIDSENRPSLITTVRGLGYKTEG
ncbi:MAG: response regulator transcription factor [Candidatus Obscuribacterales bacterium]|nr:response regulator transcription factor [Candidatus Obscuribacterales bacterium]